MRDTIAIITSAAPYQHVIIQAHVLQSHPNARVIYLCDSYMEAALAKSDALGIPPGERFRVCERLQTKASQLVYERHCKTAVVVPLIAHDPHEQGFEECCLFAMRVQEGVASWSLFSVVHLLCLTRSNRLIRTTRLRRQDSS